VQYSVDTGRSVPRCPCHSPRLTRLGQLVSLCAESQRSTSAVINHPVERCHDELAQHDIPDTPRAPRHHPRAPAAQPHRPSKRAPHPPQPTHNVGRVQNTLKRIPRASSPHHQPAVLTRRWSVYERPTEFPSSLHLVLHPTLAALIRSRRRESIKIQWVFQAYHAASHFRNH
jgi:hypothetical protein